MVAPHTISYTFAEVLKHMIPTWATMTSSREPLTEKLDPLMFVQPNAWISEYKGNAMDIETMVGFARQMATLVEFATPKKRDS